MTPGGLGVWGDGGEGCMGTGGGMRVWEPMCLVDTRVGRCFEAVRFRWAS